MWVCSLAEVARVIFSGSGPTKTSPGYCGTCFSDSVCVCVVCARCVHVCERVYMVCTCVRVWCMCVHVYVVCVYVCIWICECV